MDNLTLLLKEVIDEGKSLMWLHYEAATHLLQHAFVLGPNGSRGTAMPYTVPDHARPRVRSAFHVASVGLALQRARRAAHHPAGSFTTRLLRCR